MSTTPEDRRPDVAGSDLAMSGETAADPAPFNPAAADPPPPSSRRSMLAMVLGLTVVAATGAVFWSTGGFRLAGSEGAPDPGLPVVTMPEDSIFKGTQFVPEQPAPDFTLTNQTGAPFQMQDSRGKVALVFFGFTHCPDVCPTALGKIAAALGELGPDADRVQVVFVSVDPERDTPEVMARYLTNYDPRIVGVTGELGAIEAVAAGYNVRFYKEYPADAAAGMGTPGTGGTTDAAAHPTDPSDYTMAHSSRLFVIDPFGQMRSSFTEPYTPDDIVHDIRVLLDEADA
jgi:protein SCO1/2